MKNNGSSLIIVIIIYFLLIICSFCLFNFNLYLKNNLKMNIYNKEEILKEYTIYTDENTNFR